MSKFDLPHRAYAIRNVTWQSLCAQYASKLGFDLEEDQQEPVTSEVAHRARFKALCDEYHERQDERLLTRLHRQHDKLLEFFSTIDSINDLSPSLVALFWQLSIRAVEGAFHSELKLIELLQRTAPLDREFPALNHELLCRFEFDPDVQRPLHAIFRTYFDCYLSMFAEPATYPLILDFGTFGEKIADVGQLFASYANQWDKAAKTADLNQKRIDQTGRSSSINGASALSNATKRTSAQFIELRTLGHGTFGEVTAVQEISTRSEYARKLIRVRDRHSSTARDAVEKRVKEEVEIMQKLRHHHIATLLFYTKEPPGYTFTLIMLPVADYDLLHFLQEKCINQAFPKQEMKHLDRWFGCLASALAYAHGESIKHEDIKPTNILIKDYRPYLADFGSAKDFSESEYSVLMDAQPAGTPVYWPPEPPSQRGRPVDIFSLGCVFSEMLTVRQKQTIEAYRDARHVPDSDNGYAFKNNLLGVQEWLTNLPGLDVDVPELLLEEILTMLQSDPRERPVARRVKKRLQDILEPDPNDRPLAKQARKRLRVEEGILCCAGCS